MNTGHQLHAAVTLSKQAQDGVDQLVSDKTPFWKDMLLTPEAYRRSGRAAALAESQNMEADPRVRYPRLSNLLGILIGSGLGGAAGVGIGKLFHGAAAVPAFAGLGGTLGALAGVAWNAKERRENINEIKKRFARSEANPSRIQGGSAWAALGAGLHHQGKRDTKEFLQGRGVRPNDNYGMATLQAMSFVDPTRLSAIARMIGSMRHHMDSKSGVRTMA